MTSHVFQTLTSQRRNTVKLHKYKNDRFQGNQQMGHACFVANESIENKLFSIIVKLLTNKAVSKI